MDASSLSFQITILQAKNVELKSHGTLFVRYYIPAGNNKRIQLNTREIPTNSSILSWNESFSLECQGTEASMASLRKESVVFELRWRSRSPLLGRIVGGSQVVARAEVPWSSVLESPNMEMEKWAVMAPKSAWLLDGGFKPPSIQIDMRVGAPKLVKMESKEERRRRSRRVNRLSNCGCCDSGCRCEDYEVFALAAALEAL